MNCYVELPQLVEHHTGYSLNVRYYILMLLPFVLAMGLIRDLKWLVPFSQMSNVLFVLGLSITMYYVLKDAPSPLSVRQYGSASDYPLFLSAMIYGMENIGVVSTDCRSFIWISITRVAVV